MLWLNYIVFVVVVIECDLLVDFSIVLCSKHFQII